MSSQKNRYERILKRGRKDDIKNFSQFIERENRELSWGLGNLIALADYFIVNEGTIEQYKENVRSFLESFKDC
ncbi:MAG: hypothetical protein QW649_03750 [Thermoplasmata archaeon]